MFGTEPSGLGIVLLKAGEKVLPGKPRSAAVSQSPLPNAVGIWAAMLTSKVTEVLEAALTTVDDLCKRGPSTTWRNSQFLLFRGG